MLNASIEYSNPHKDATSVSRTAEPLTQPLSRPQFSRGTGASTFHQPLGACQRISSIVGDV